MLKVKNIIKFSPGLSETWIKNNKHLYESGNKFLGAYENDKYFVIFDVFFDGKRYIKHISISYKKKKKIEMNREISIIAKNLLNSYFEVDEQVATDKVLNIYEKIVN